MGISADFIFSPADASKLSNIKQLSSTHYFVEEYIDGREFNVSLLSSGAGMEVLPPAEMVFSKYFDDKPKIVGYKAKWDEQSEEYKQTNRSFATLANDEPLKDKIVSVCLETWDAFKLKGYVRIDFRMDASDNLYILEVNGNPCISPDSGFVAAIQEAGYTTEEMVRRILEDTN